MSSLATATPITGRVIKYHSNVYCVQVLRPDGSLRLYDCLLKATLKKQQQALLTGDWVTLDTLNESPMGSADIDTGQAIIGDRGSARVVAVHPRLNQLARPKIANIDQVLILHPLRQPQFDAKQLDRLLTQVQLAKHTVCIGLTKADLCTNPDELASIMALYHDRLGLSVFACSRYQPDSLLPLQACLAGKTTVLAGVSGAGKSSFINALYPDFDLRTGLVSDKLGRGQHTTRHVELLTLPLAPNTYLADTPGFSHLSFDTLLPKDFAAQFAEFSTVAGDCTFSDCLHVLSSANTTAGELLRELLTDDDDDHETASQTEAHCVLSPWFTPNGSLEPNNPIISPSRYDSYRAMLAEAVDYKARYKVQSHKIQASTKALHRGDNETLAVLRLDEQSRANSRRKDKQALEQLKQHTRPASSQYSIPVAKD
jgi:ribosome biogenesis GTPase / thiamine phosphate phosphatase